MLLRKLKGPPPPYGPFKMPSSVGILINTAAICYLTFVITWMPFPQLLPVTAENMNYAGVLVGALIIGAVLDWCISGRKRFRMPVVKYGDE
jgi:choline transport protein